MLSNMAKAIIFIVKTTQFTRATGNRAKSKDLGN